MAIETASDTATEPKAKRTRKPRAAKPEGKARKAATSKRADGPAPTGKAKAYIDDLRTTPEKRYATKEWKRLAGARATRPTPFGLNAGRANTIRDEIAALVNGKAKAD